MAATLGDLFALSAKVSAAAAKPMRLYAENAKAVALMAEELDRPRQDELPRVVPVRCPHCGGRLAG